jgi:hypothetical protein
LNDGVYFSIKTLDPTINSTRPKKINYCPKKHNTSRI